MSRDSIVPFSTTGQKFRDELTELLCQGAQQLLQQAVEEEIRSFMAHYAHLRDASGRQDIVRNGYLPARSIQTGIGPLEVQVPRSRDRGGHGVKFSSALLPPYLKRTKSLDELLPYLYLKGLSSGDFSEALEALLGPKAKGFAATNISRLKEQWQQDLETFQKRNLSKKRYVYFWADGVYLEARLEERQCMLVIIGADETGKKELVALSGGFRESEFSWHELLLDLKNRGLICSPELCIGDGALGFWKAVKKVYGQARQQRCWVHKTVNVLNKLPESLQQQAKQGLQAIWMKADTKEEAEKAFDTFLEVYGDKYPKATQCLEKDREALLTFFDFPASHWRSIRTTNPIESVFSVVKHRTVKTKGCLFLRMAEIMAFKLIEAAQKRWIRLYGSQHMAETIRGVNFKNGIAEQDEIRQTKALNQKQGCAA